MRLIDADKAVEQIKEWLDQTRAIPLDTSYYFELLGCVEDCPTIDAVPVVRCKECGHYDTTGFPALNPGTGWCDKMGKGVHDDFYCFYGERKESEGST